MRSLFTPSTLWRTGVVAATATLLSACGGDTDPDFELAEDLTDSELQIVAPLSIFAWETRVGETSYRLLIDFDGPDENDEFEYVQQGPDLLADTETDDYVCTLATTDDDPDTVDVPGSCEYTVDIPLRLLTQEMAVFRVEAFIDGEWEEIVGTAVASAPGFAKLAFGWTTAAGETSYRFFVDPDGDSDNDGEFEFEQVGDDLLAGTETDDYHCTVAAPDAFGNCVISLDIQPHLLDWKNARYRVQACVGADCTELGQQTVRGLSRFYVSTFVNAGIVSAYADDVDRIVIGAPLTSTFECDVLEPVDVDTLEEGEFLEDCQYDDELTGDDIPETLLETIVLAGSATVFSLVDDVWEQEAFIKASNIGEGDNFGIDVAISDDGNTVAVAANVEDSNVTTVGNGPAIDNGGDNDDEADSGAVYILTRGFDDDMEPVWNEVAYLKPQNTQGDPDTEDDELDGDQFGSVVTISGDGLTVAVSSFGEDSATMGIGTGAPGEGADNDAENAGAVYIFRNVGGTWGLEAYVKPSNTGFNDAFGSSLTLSDNGDRLAVGAIRESSDATGVGGDPFNDNSENAGAVYVFERSGSTWSEAAYLKAANPDPRDEFGFGVAFNSAADVLVVSAPQEDSSSREINGDPLDDRGPDRNVGAAYVFELDAGEWAQTAYLKAANADPIDELGFSLAIAEKDVDGETETRVLVASIREGGVQAGINPSDDLDSFLGAGACYLFIRDSDDGDWRQQSYIKAPNNAPGILFGWDTDFAADGDRLLINSFGNTFQSPTVYLY